MRLLRVAALRRVLVVVGLLLWTASFVSAHPAPFSYLDLRLDDGRIDARLVLHTIDVGHELGVEPATLLDPQILPKHTDAIVRLLKARLLLAAGGAGVEWQLARLEPVPERDAIAAAWFAPVERLPGRIGLSAHLFPYDPNHQTFVNVYERGTLVRQEVFGAGRTSAEFYSGTPQGRLALVRAFTASGVHHIAIGPDHVLFVVGLLLLGGTIPRLLLIVSAFTAGHSVTLSLATLGILEVPSHIVEPAIALSIVYVGADNLLAGQQGRDVRPWVALVFGLIHGFGFASVLRETGLPPESIGLSLFSFNLGVEIGQAAIVIAVTAALGAIRSRRPALSRRITVIGSVAVAAAGAYWFVERVF